MKAGVTDVYALLGGWNDWVRLNNEIETGLPAGANPAPKN